VVVAAVRCPYCGGSVELPKEGDTTKCPYCGTTLKAVDLYKVLLEMFKALASQALRGRRAEPRAASLGARAAGKQGKKLLGSERARRRAGRQADIPPSMRFSCRC